MARRGQVRSAWCKNSKSSRGEASARWRLTTEACAWGLLVWPQNQPVAGSSVWASKPTRRLGGIAVRSVRQAARTGSFEVRRGASTRRTRGVTKELASEGSKAWWMRVPAGKDIRVIFQICPYGVCISRGSLVISIPPLGL